MTNYETTKIIKFSIVVPCFNEEKTLRKCIEKVLEIADETLSLEIIIVDDCSSDQSLIIARELEDKYQEIVVLNHKKNQGKGAALRTGIKRATGDFVAVQDADLEYNPMEFKKLLVPLINNQADVVFGSRFLSAGHHRVLYFWHYMGNRLLTFLSNMFTDLNLTDMETCYKVFKSEIIQNIQIKENRFGFEPEIVAKVAHMRLRIFEIGISYYARTYEEGKKIGVKDGVRALYCIFRYNAHFAPIPIQFLIYIFIGSFCAVVNLFIFLGLFKAGFVITIASPAAFIIAAIVNYFLCILLLFKHKVRWNTKTEATLFLLIVMLVGACDLGLTKMFLLFGMYVGVSKLLASGICLLLNFLGRRFLVFPETTSGPRKPQENK
jgi:glycosyltransferase involved in cell wall biosynthesis